MVINLSFNKMKLKSELGRTTGKTIMEEIEVLKAERSSPSYGVSGCKPVPAEGRLASIASRILMQVLYAARFARHDFLRCINGLA